MLRSCGSSGGSGFQLMNQGGWATEGTQHDGPAFICRIGYSGFQNGAKYPTPSEQDCVLTPPATAYWSFWLAPAGQNTWTYSPLGAMSDRTKPGEVEAWVFGGTDVGGTQGQPSFSPESVRPPVDQPPADPAGGAPGGGRTPAPPADPGNPATPTSSTTVTTSTSTMTTSCAPPLPCPTPTGTTTSSSKPSIVNGEPRAAVEQSAGSPLPVIIGGALVLLIAAAGGVLVWRRRKQG